MGIDLRTGGLDRAERIECSTGAPAASAHPAKRLGAVALAPCGGSQSVAGLALAPLIDNNGQEGFTMKFLLTTTICTVREFGDIDSRCSNLYRVYITVAHTRPVVVPCHAMEMLAQKRHTEQ